MKLTQIPPPSSTGTAAATPAPHLPFHDSRHHIKIFQGDCLELLPVIPENSVDLIFADPPYFLSNGGITCHAGRMVSVNKGQWDRSRGVDENHKFNLAWLAACQRVLKPNGSIWVSGTAHVIHSVGFAMQQLGFKLLNDTSANRLKLTLCRGQHCQDRRGSENCSSLLDFGIVFPSAGVNSF